MPRLFTPSPLLVPHEAEEVKPALKLIPGKASVCSQEPLEHPMGLVDFRHWISAVPELRSRTRFRHFGSQQEPDYYPALALLLVVDEGRILPDVRNAASFHLGRGRLPHPARDQETPAPIRSGADATLVSGKTAKALSTFRPSFGFPYGNVGLIDPPRRERTIIPWHPTSTRYSPSIRKRVSSGNQLSSRLMGRTSSHTPKPRVRSSSGAPSWSIERGRRTAKPGCDEIDERDLLVIEPNFARGRSLQAGGGASIEPQSLMPNVSREFF